MGWVGWGGGAATLPINRILPNVSKNKRYMGYFVLLFSSLLHHELSHRVINIGDQN